MVMHASNSSIWVVEEENSRVQGQSQLHIQTKVTLGCTHPLAARDIAREGVLAQHVPVRASWLYSNCTHYMCGSHFSALAFLSK